MDDDDFAVETLSLTEDTTLSEEQTLRFASGHLRVRLNGFRLWTTPIGDIRNSPAGALGGGRGGDTSIMIVGNRFVFFNEPVEPRAVLREHARDCAKVQDPSNGAPCDCGFER